VGCESEYETHVLDSITDFFQKLLVAEVTAASERNIFGGFHAWPKTSLDFACGEARLVPADARYGRIA
jgi:hypothetical protein